MTRHRPDLLADPTDAVWDDDPVDATTLGSAAMFSGPKLPPLPAVGTFGNFEILGRIARGGMADVFLARERSLGMTRHVVLKRILPAYEEDAEFQRMFKDEGEVATRFFHPNVCHVYEVGEADGRTFLTLEFVYGVTLDKLGERAHERGGMPVHLAAFLMSKVAAGLDYVHRATGVNGRPLNIVHRDVTPQNIMIGWDGRVKLLDFGIAKTSGASGDGSVAGKYAYLSPEQVRGESLDGRADVFAMGICLYELLLGKPLYKLQSTPVIMQAIVYDPIPSLRDVRPDLPDELEEIVQRALQKDREDRFATAHELEFALQTFCTQFDEHDVAAFLWRNFDESERAPLPARSAEFTGAHVPVEVAAEDEDPLAVDVSVDTAEPGSSEGHPQRAESPAGPRGYVWALVGALLLIAAAAAIGAAVYLR